MSQKNLRRFYYALIDLSKGDSLLALVTVNTDCEALIVASGFMHRIHPLHHDFGVFRSTDIGYFGGKSVQIAVNGRKFGE